MTRKLSGDHTGWLTSVAREIREAGKPVSLDSLCRVVPRQLVTATNDGHVTAAENGLDRDDHQAGQRIWVEEAIAALEQANLISTRNGSVSWAAEQDGTWKVKFGNSARTIHGQAESASGRDSHMLGSAKTPGYLLKGWAEAEVDVEQGVAGEIAKGRHTFEVHPLAFAIPAMTKPEQEQVRADIEAHGVRQPLILYRDPGDRTARGKPRLKVLDGRHRLQFASVLNKPIRVEVFKGTEKEARQLVSSLNLQRRHLTNAQRALAVVELFGQQAKAEAKRDQKEAVKRGNRSRSNSAPSSEDVHGTGNGKSGGKEWPDRARDMAGGDASGVTANAIKDADKIAQAPKTKAKVASGEIKALAAGKQQAAEELGQPKQASVANEKTVTEHVGNARYELRQAAGMSKLGKKSPGEVEEILDEFVDDLIPRIRKRIKKGTP